MNPWLKSNKERLLEGLVAERDFAQLAALASAGDPDALQVMDEIQRVQEEQFARGLESGGSPKALKGT
jgi:hypothetical protein